MQGLKNDKGKLDWSLLPLELIEPLVKIFAAGAEKYGRDNWRKGFAQADKRFYAAAMRHTAACQADPLAVDTETGCDHAAQAAWNHLIRLYIAKEEKCFMNTLAQDAEIQRQNHLSQICTARRRGDKKEETIFGKNPA